MVLALKMHDVLNTCDLIFIHAGQPTLQATPNVLIRAQSSDSVTLSWGPVVGGVNHTVLFYTYDSILLQDVGTSTFAAFNNQASYLVLVISVSDDSYGVTVALYDIDFETGS